MGFAAPTPLALIVGRDFAAAGVGLATEVLARVESLRLLVVGGEEAAFRSYRDLAYAQGTADRLYHIAETDLVTPYYAAADLFLHLDVYAGHSLRLLEAAASGLALVATRTGGIGTVLEDSVSGFVVERSVAAASEAAAKLVADRSQREAMGRAAHEKSLAFSWDQMVERSEALLSSLLAARRGGGRPAASPTPPA
jgi:glycosyltransferase involved in cell wall biosynthesis